MYQVFAENLICSIGPFAERQIQDGPVFQKPLQFQIGEKIEMGDYAVVDIT